MTKHLSIEHSIRMLPIDSNYGLSPIDADYQETTKKYVASLASFAVASESACHLELTSKFQHASVLPNIDGAP